MKTALLYIVIIIAIIEAGYIYNLLKNNSLSDSSLPTILPIEKPLQAYTFVNLKKTKFLPTDIILGKEVSETASSTARLFYFSTPTTPNSTSTKKVSGLINIPKAPGTYPVIVMFRGYVPTDIYEPGMGTQPSAALFSQQGFITLAPDFLGFGTSDTPSKDSFEDRFETYTTALSLLSSLSTLNTELNQQYGESSITADIDDVQLWGHSNGGHIALATLAITGKNYPTVLWAPVSRSFPYSILYYTDEYDDQGKATRKALADFEKTYDTQAFSPPRYYRYITAPIAIFQGGNDQEVLHWWSTELAEQLKKYKLDITYTQYPNADHNLQPDGWSSAVSNSILFYRTW